MIEPNSLPVLLEPEQLLPYLSHKDVLLIDVCSNENYARHHIPGAVHIPPSSLQCGRAPAPGKLPSIEQLNQLFSQLGLDGTKHVIAYDDEGGGWAGRLLWTLEVVGHKHYSYLNGGLHSWMNEGHPTESGSVTPIPSGFKASIDNSHIASIEDVKASLGNQNFAIWDARSAQEYNGTKVVSKRAGHIPGAINIDWLELMDRSRNLRLIDLEALQQRLNELTLTKNKTIITHCQTHHRSGLSWLAMRILGYPNILGYDGSWSEWGNREDTPIEI